MHTQYSLCSTIRWKLASILVVDGSWYARQKNIKSIWIIPSANPTATAILFKLKPSSRQNAVITTKLKFNGNMNAIRTKIFDIFMRLIWTHDSLNMPVRDNIFLQVLNTVKSVFGFLWRFLLSTEKAITIMFDCFRSDSRMFWKKMRSVPDYKSQKISILLYFFPDIHSVNSTLNTLKLGFVDSK